MENFSSRLAPPLRNRDSSGWRPQALILLVAILAGSGFGCSTMSSIEPLEVTLADLKITEVTVFETSLAATLRVTNPNPEAVAIDGASFKLYLEDKKVGSGTTKERFTVDRLDSSVVQVVFHVNNASAILRLKDILEDDRVSYGISGGLFTQGTFGTKKLKVEKTGSIDLGKVTPLAIDEPDTVNPPTPK